MGSSVKSRLEKLALVGGREKSASVAELSSIADLASSGALGDEVRYAFEGITSAIDNHVEEDVAEKTASIAQTDYNIYDENAARIARLNNLLHK
jgi:hypothetical protein